MAEKKTRKTRKKATPKTKATAMVVTEGLLNEIVEVLKKIDAKLDLIYGSKPSTILAPAQGGGEEKGEGEKSNVIETTDKDETERSSVLINQSGEAVELTYDVVKAEAEKLVTIDQFAEKQGFAKAREIIIGYKVTKLEDVPKENYPEIVEQFRKAVLEWK